LLTRDVWMRPHEYDHWRPRNDRERQYPPQSDAPAPTKPATAAAQAKGDTSQQKRRRKPRRLSKVHTAIVTLKYRAKLERESIRVQDIADEAGCSFQNLYKSLEFMSEWNSARARRIKRGWKIDGTADRPDDSTFYMDES
jgi:hypothetical protein